MRLINSKGKTPKILVVGDVILDEYLHCTCNRISPEAPVPVVLNQSSTYKLGGAANVAANIASVGVEVDLVGAAGDDENESKIYGLCNLHKINASLVSCLNQTTVKKRVIVDSQQMIRIDKESPKDIDSIEFTGADFDIIVVSDYAKGVITQGTMDNLKKLKIPIIVDPKPKNIDLYHRVDLITPNEEEFNKMTICPRMKIDNLLVTRGSLGMSLYENVGSGMPISQFNIPSEAREVFDVTGAGDTVVGIIAVCLAAQIDLQNACKVANKAAAITISHHGTSTINYGQLSKCYLDVTTTRVNGRNK